MNERIRELAEQADAYAWQQIDEGANFDEQPRFFAEKFAELILRECAEVLDTWNKENGAEEGLDKAGLISLWSPHFGVEE